MHVLDIIVLVIIGLLAIIGAGKGFVNTVLGFLSTVLAIIVASLLAGEVGKMLYGFSFAGPTWGESIADGFRATLSSQEGLLTTVPEGGYTTENVVAILETAGIPMIIGNLIAPAICEALVGYGEITLVDAIAPVLANIVLTALAFVLLYVVVWAIVRAIARAINNAMNEFFLVKSVDALLGLILGAIKGVVIVWVALTLCSIVTFIPGVNELIQSTAIVNWLADHNLVALLVTSGFDVKGVLDQITSPV